MRIGEMEAPELLRAAPLIDPEYRQRIRAAAQKPPGGIGRAARAADGQHLVPRGAHRPHQRRPADAQGCQELCGRQVRPAGAAASATSG